MPCKTDCPRCGADGELVLIGARVHPQDPTLIKPDGFVIKGSFATSEEAVMCRVCGWSGDLQYEEEE